MAMKGFTGGNMCVCACGGIILFMPGGGTFSMGNCNSAAGGGALSVCI